MTSASADTPASADRPASADIPAPAATVVLLDEGDPARIFFVKRHRRSAFMPNMYVFPGGRVDGADADPALLARLRQLDPSALAARMAPIDGPEAALAHLVCAARETFEEAGVLLALGAEGGLPATLTVSALAKAREELRSGQVGFAALLARWGLGLRGGGLVYFDHWITPPGERRRFDARFFATRAPQGQRYSHDGVETSGSCWLTAAEALARHEAGQLGLAPPTFWILRRLRRLRTASEVLAWAAAREVSTIAPVVRADGGRVIVDVDGAAVVAHDGVRWVVQ